MAEALEEYLQQWRAGAPAGRQASTVQELQTPPRSSLRPHEIVPRVYLGGIRDVANVRALMRNVKKESVRRWHADMALKDVGPAQPCLHRVWLLVAACSELDTPESGEAHTEGEGVPEAVADNASERCGGSLLELRRVLSPEEVGRLPAAGHPVRSVRLTSDSLAELEAQCHRDGGDEMSWWKAFLTRRACVATLGTTRPAQPPQPPPLLYWRLLLPVEDSPAVALRPSFHIVSVITRAALDASCTQPGRGAEGTPSSSVPDITGAEVKPCVVFHCMAGRSRSATLLMSFLLEEWHRGLSPHSVPVVNESSVSDEAARLVQRLLRFVQARRPIVSPNEGFYAALRAHAEAILLALM